MKKQFSTFDIIKALGIKRERLRAWMKKGYVYPHMPSPGQGQSALFTIYEVFGIALFDKLLKNGFKRETAAEYYSVCSGNGFTGGDYLVIRADEIDGERDLRPFFIMGTLETTQSLLILEIMPDGSLSQRTPPFGAEIIPDWEDISIINFGRIKDEVEKKLKVLG